jgi:hypothetical protein
MRCASSDAATFLHFPDIRQIVAMLAYGVTFCLVANSLLRGPMTYRRFFLAVNRTVFILALVPLGWTTQNQFVVAKNLPAGTLSLAVAVADFNGDGKPDMALIHSDSSQVTIRLGNGNGTFGAAKHFRLEHSPSP